MVSFASVQEKDIQYWDFFEYCFLKLESKPVKRVKGNNFTTKKKATFKNIQEKNVA